MDGSAIIFWAVILLIIAAAFYAGLKLGERVGESNALKQVNRVSATVPQFNWKEKIKVLHECDPWDEMRLDQEDKPKVVQTVEQTHE